MSVDLDSPGYPPEAFAPAVSMDMVGLRDRALTVAMTLTNSSVADLISNADVIQSYIMTGAVNADI